jgi:hypothetical protein
VSSLNAWGANQNTPLIDIKNEKALLDELDRLLKLTKGNFTDEYLQRVEAKITEILAHLKTLRDTTHIEPGPEPFDAVKYLRDHWRLLN